MAAEEKLIFPIGFDLQKGVDDAAKEWESTYSKKLQKEIGKKPIEIKLKLSTTGIQDLERITALSKEQRQALNDEILLLQKKQAQDDAGWKAARRRNSEEQERHNKSRHAHIQRMDQIREEIRLATKQAEIERKNSGEWKKQAGILGQLKSMMSAYLGVKGFFNIMRQIKDMTGEFELQRVSLGAILQNQREANILFSQIKETALKSPFQVKDLVRYTKQLAAFRVEYDELFDTMNRLSDISAGLGVDMNRIILAYGQVKAAAVLRGTELRQFTEAGIPMVDALAKKLTELRGELVTTSQVFGLISERAVSFEVVRDVLMEMTEAGGVFNKMQEKQAKTVKGQWANLMDAKEIMLAEMGDTFVFGGLIKGYIWLLRNLANGWRIVVPAISLAVAAIGMFTIKVAKGSTVLKQFILFLNTSKKAAAGLVAAIIGTLVGIVLHLNKTNSAIRKIRKTATQDVRVAEDTFRSLANQIVNATDGSIEQAEALSELKRRYGDVIPLQMQSVEALRQMEGAYDGVVSAIKRKIVAQAHEEQVAELSKGYTKRLSNLEAALGTQYLFFTKEGLQRTAKLTEVQVAQIVKYIEGLPDEVSEITQEAAQEFADAFGFGDSTFATSVWKRMSEYLSALRGWEDKQKSLLEKLERKTGVSLGGLEDIWKRTTEEITRESKLIGLSGDPISKKDERNAKLKIDKYTQFLKESFARAGIEANNIDVSNIKSLEELAKSASIAYRTDLYTAINRVNEALNKTTAWRRVFADAKKYYNLVSGEESSVFIGKEKIEAYESQNAALEEVAKGYKEAVEAIDGYTRALETIPKSDTSTIESNKNDKARSEALKELYAYLLDYFNAWHLLDKKSRGGDNQLQILKQRADLIKKLYKEYLELVKLQDAEIALTKLREEHGETMANLGLEDIPKTADEASAALRALLPELEALGKRGEAFKIRLQYDIEQVQIKELQSKLEKEIDDIQREITRKQSAKNLFDELLGLTGNRQLSADLTLNLYGGIGNDIVGAMIHQLEAAFRGVNVSGAIDGYNVDIPALEALLPQIPEKQQRENALKVLQAFREMRGDVYAELYKAYDDFMSFEDRKTIALAKAEAERKKIREAGISDEQQKLLGDAVNKKLAKDLNEIEIEQFKEENNWGQIFADLDKVAVPTLRDMIAKIKEFIHLNRDLSVEQYKSLYEHLEKLGDSLQDRDPFGVLAESIESYRKAMQEYLFTKDVYDKIDSKLQGTDPNSSEFATLVQARATALKNLEKAHLGVENAQSEMMAGLSASASFFSKAGDAVSNFAEVLGISEDTEFGAFLNDLSSSLSSIGSVLGLVTTGFQLATAAGLAMETALAPLLAIAAALIAVMAVVKYFAGAKVRAAERELERLEKVVNELEYAFKRLEKAAEGAFSEDFLQNYKERIDNLERQAEAYRKMADAERSKGKKSDEGKIQDFLESAREATDEIKDMRDELQEKFLGSSLADAARDFASAWLEARISFASTADAVREKFDEMMQNLVVESLLGQVMKKALEPVFNMIDNMQESDFYDAGFWANITKAGKEAIDNGMAGAENVMSFLEASGVRLGQMGTGLKGISKDIATASEESILGLAAGINTQNFYISQIHANVAQIVRLLQGESVATTAGVNLQDLMTIQNEHLSHLPNIAMNTANTAARCERAAVACERIAEDLGKVIKPKGVSATHTVSTSM